MDALHKCVLSNYFGIETQCKEDVLSKYCILTVFLTVTASKHETISDKYFTSFPSSSANNVK
jgi:hypothetical protein